MKSAAAHVEPRAAAADPARSGEAAQALTLAEVERIRSDFPILARVVRGKPLAYLDNAATAQKPRTVINAVREHYEKHNANVHRGVHTLSQEATQTYEGAREQAARFVGARDAREIVFVRGATEAVNLIAQSFARPRLKPRDEVLITHLEHHSNIVPWQLVCQQTGATLRVAPIDDSGAVILDEFERLLSERTKIAAFAHISNALGTVNPVREMTALAKRVGAAVFIDGAQAAPHIPIGVSDIGCDFYAFTGHKMFGPTGIGALYARANLLEAMPPYQGGGEMIASVSFEKTTWNAIPHKFEAGTPNIAGAIGLAAAIEYIDAVGVKRFAAWEADLLERAAAGVAELPGVRLIGAAPNKASILSFDVEGVHPHDIGAVLDNAGVAVRTGHHCAQPVMDRFGVPATTRASFAFYNTPAEVDALTAAVQQAIDMFR